MKGRLLVGLAVTIAVAGAIAIGVDAAVAGIDKAAGLAGVIVGFCELAALALGVAGFMADRREGRSKGERPGVGEVAAAATSPSAPASGAPADGPAVQGKYVVDVRDASGVQIGDHNVQHNEFG